MLPDVQSVGTAASGERKGKPGFGRGKIISITHLIRRHHEELYLLRRTSIASHDIAFGPVRYVDLEPFITQQIRTGSLGDKNFGSIVPASGGRGGSAAFLGLCLGIAAAAACRAAHKRQYQTENAAKYAFFHLFHSSLLRNPPMISTINHIIGRGEGQVGILQNFPVFARDGTCSIKIDDFPPISMEIMEKNEKISFTFLSVNANII